VRGVDAAFVPPGDPLLRTEPGSEFCLNRLEMPNISPKLLRPVVENDVLPDEGRGGEGWCSVSRMFVTESRVEDLALFPNRLRLRTDGVECAEFAELDESFRARGGREADKPAEDRDGEGSGDMWSCPSEASERRVGPSGTDLDCVRPAAGPSAPNCDPVGFGGSGKSGPRFRFSRGIRKRLLRVVAPPGELVLDSPFSPVLWSEREDSEYRTSTTEERWEPLGRSRPALRIDVVDKRPGSSVLTLEAANDGSTL
jgi:hypothetical protein